MLIALSASYILGSNLPPQNKKKCMDKPNSVENADLHEIQQ